MPQITQATLDGLYTAFNTIFNKSLEGVEPTWPKVAMSVPSSTRENDYRWMRKLPKMREWIGDRVIHGLESQGYKILNKDWEQTIAVDRNDIEDDQIGIYNPLFAEMGRAVAEHPDELVWGLLKNGFAETGFDGQFFFDTDHPVLDESGQEISVSNFQGGTGTPWFLLDTSKAIKPLIFQERRPPQFVRKDDARDDNVFHRKEYIYGVDGRWNAGYGLWQLAYASKQPLDATNYMAARAAMQSLKGDYGRPLRIRPTLLVVPPALEEAALQVLKAERDAQGATNVARGTAELHVEPLLA